MKYFIFCDSQTSVFQSIIVFIIKYFPSDKLFFFCLFSIHFFMIYFRYLCVQFQFCSTNFCFLSIFLIYILLCISQIKTRGNKIKMRERERERKKMRKHYMTWSVIDIDVLLHWDLFALQTSNIEYFVPQMDEKMHSMAAVHNKFIRTINFLFILQIN